MNRDVVRAAVQAHIRAVMECEDFPDDETTLYAMEQALTAFVRPLLELIADREAHPVFGLWPRSIYILSAAEVLGALGVER